MPGGPIARRPGREPRTARTVNVPSPAVDCAPAPTPPLAGGFARPGRMRAPAPEPPGHFTKTAVTVVCRRRRFASTFSPVPSARSSQRIDRRRWPPTIFHSGKNNCCNFAYNRVRRSRFRPEKITVFPKSSYRPVSTLFGNLPRIAYPRVHPPRRCANTIAVYSVTTPFRGFLPRLTFFPCILCPCYLCVCPVRYVYRISLFSRLKIDFDLCVSRRRDENKGGADVTVFSVTT